MAAALGFETSRAAGDRELPGSPAPPSIAALYTLDTRRAPHHVLGRFEAPTPIRASSPTAPPSRRRLRHDGVEVACASPAVDVELRRDFPRSTSAPPALLVEPSTSCSVVPTLQQARSAQGPTPRRRGPHGTAVESSHRRASASPAREVPAHTLTGLPRPSQPVADAPGSTGKGVARRRRRSRLPRTNAFALVYVASNTTATSNDPSVAQVAMQSGSTSPRRSAAPSPGRRPAGSATPTRGAWPRSVATLRWPSCRSASASAAPSAGGRGSPSTCSSSWASATGCRCS